MRKCEQKMVAAIREKREWHLNNTHVERRDGFSNVWLHGNHIANVLDDGTVRVNFATLHSWPTPTTISRLRALGVNVYRRDWVVYVNDEPI